MIDDAAARALQERKAVNKLLDLSRQIPLYSLLALLVLLLYTVHLLTQRFMKPLNRLIDSTQRIAHGDFSPMLPMRRYRDEFTMVNVAINRMLQELDGHQTAMVESHKLRAIGTLTAGVAHELNNPLNNIMLTAHSMLEDYQELTESERLEMIRDLIQETDRSQSIVRNLLDFARESECVSEPLDLGVLIDETVKLAFNRAKISGATLTVNIQPNLPQIHGDRQQLKQMLLNLILNALDAVAQKGVVGIRAEKAFTPGFVAVHVEDNGCGIPEHMLPYIFDPFFTTKAPKQGTGLGLSVSHGIVTNHGGAIKVASQEGVYTRFTVTLPSAGILADQCKVS
jgi:signal transduction histidine kinase